MAAELGLERQSKEDGNVYFLVGWFLFLWLGMEILTTFDSLSETKMPVRNVEGK